MKPTQKSRAKNAQPPSAVQTTHGSRSLGCLVVFGAHPDDIEFGCGGVVAKETRGGRPVHFVICSRGESASNGTPAQRMFEAKKAAALLSATWEFVDLDGDAHLEVKAAHAIKLAAILRRTRPAIVLAPTLEENQHPDHPKLGQLVRDACRLARYGGLEELRGVAVHTTGILLFYAVSPEAEPQLAMPVLIDVSAPEVVSVWTLAMNAHSSQMKTRNYAELQLARARVHGLRAGVAYAIPLWPNDPLVFDSVAACENSARLF